MEKEFEIIEMPQGGDGDEVLWGVGGCIADV